MAAKKKTAKAEGHIYLLRGIDKGTWAKVVKRAAAEGRDVSWLMLAFLDKYAAGEAKA